jgi:methionyl aminopeptidase
VSKRQQKRRLSRRRDASQPGTGRGTASGRAPVRVGRVSPPRSVPAAIPRPPYAPDAPPFQAAVPPAERAEHMRVAGRAAREVLLELAPHVQPGVTTDELDRICHEACVARGGYPSPLHYKGYPKALCTSINEIVCHGIPDDRPLREGDIVNLDVTIFLGGVHGDHSETFCVGEVDPDAARLVDVTLECLWEGIRAVAPGAPVNAIGRAIEDRATADGFSVVRTFVGHGVGEVFHTVPSVPHYFDPRAADRLEPGWTFTIEPMINAGSWQCGPIWPDDWTAPTADLSLSAQFEHTVLVTPSGVEVLTLLPEESRGPESSVSRARRLRAGTGDAPVGVSERG